MKKTRNLFVLIGKRKDIICVLSELDFKGIKILEKKNISTEDIENIFNTNKSVVCSYLPPPDFRESAIYVDVVSNCLSPHIHSDFIYLKDNIPEQFESIANKHNCDIGDHKSKTSGLNGAPSIEDCYYCNYLKRTLNEKNERTIYRSPNFFVIPTIGQFIPGYLLIIPNEHVMSNAELSPEIRKEFFEVLNDILFILRLTYGKYRLLVWENGTGNSGKGKAIDSIVHAHTHVTPSNLTVSEIEKLSMFPLKKISPEEISDYDKTSYLLIRDEAEKIWRINSDPNIYIPRQYIRQLLTEENNIKGELWNWRSYPFTEQMMQTCVDVSQALRKNWDSLPERIKLYTRHYIFDF